MPSSGAATPGTPLRPTVQGVPNKLRRHKPIRKCRAKPSTSAACAASTPPCIRSQTRHHNDRDTTTDHSVWWGETRNPTFRTFRRTSTKFRTRVINLGANQELLLKFFQMHEGPPPGWLPLRIVTRLGSVGFGLPQQRWSRDVPHLPQPACPVCRYPASDGRVPSKRAPRVPSTAPVLAALHLRPSDTAMNSS